MQARQARVANHQFPLYSTLHTQYETVFVTLFSIIHTKRYQILHNFSNNSQIGWATINLFASLSIHNSKSIDQSWEYVYIIFLIILKLAEQP